MANSFHETRCSCPVHDDEHNFYDSLQAHLTGEIGYFGTFTTDRLTGKASPLKKGLTEVIYRMLSELFYKEERELRFPRRHAIQSNYWATERLLACWFISDSMVRESKTEVTFSVHPFCSLAFCLSQ